MDTFQSKGGKATAAKMTPEQLSERARNAALARTEKAKLPVAGYKGTLTLGASELGCYVLPGGVSVFSQRALQSSIGMSEGGSKTGEQKLVVFLGAVIEKQTGDSELVARANSVVERLKNPIRFKHEGKSTYGYEATVLADLCDVVLGARANASLHPTQERIADQCELLVRGFARVGLNALVYEATGYKDVADAQAMQHILDEFLSKELARWSKRFPDTFYKEIFRLKGWKYDPASVKRPSVIGYYTKDIVYSRLAPGVLEELEKQNPTENGKRKAKHHQWLSPGIGHAKLAEVIGGVTMAMRLSSTWDQFKQILDRTIPKVGETIPLVYGDEDYQIEREELMLPGPLSTTGSPSQP